MGEHKTRVGGGGGGQLIKPPAGAGARRRLVRSLSGENPRDD